MAHEIRLVTESDLRQTMAIDESTIDCIDAAFAKLATGNVVMPPILSMAMEDINAEVDVKTAYVPGLEGFAIKISPGFFNNPALGLPSLNGLMVLLSARTGQVLAVFLDNGFLTDVRTAAAGAVAARHLAPEVVETAGVLGTGMQARLQMIAASRVRSFKQVLVWGRSGPAAEQFAEEMSQTLGVPVAAMSDPDEIVARSQLVVTTTPAKTPILSADALHPGLHITAMGSDQDDKNEIDPAVLARADGLVCDRISQCEKLGELRTALESGVLADTSSVVELGAISAGHSPGRTRHDEVTLCDLTGTGIQDTAIATLANERTVAAGLGTRVST